MEFVKTLKRVVPRKLHRHLGVTRRWLRTIPPQVRLQKEQLLSDPSLSDGECDLLRKASTRVYYGDTMYDGKHYYRVGLSAISCINEAAKLAGLTKVGSILDLPCGSGRVLRFLVHQFPEAEITACELEPGPVEFCARTFGAQAAYSSPNLREVSLGKKFDLIWCGSLVTHLNDRSIRDLLRVFQRHHQPLVYLYSQLMATLCLIACPPASLTTCLAESRSTEFAETIRLPVMLLKTILRLKTGVYR